MIGIDAVTILNGLLVAGLMWTARTLWTMNTIMAQLQSEITHNKERIEKLEETHEKKNGV